MQSHPERFLGVFVADPNVTDPETWMEDITKSHKNWVPWSCVREARINIVGKGMIEYIQLAFPMLVLLCGSFEFYATCIENRPLRCLFESVFGMIRYNIPGCSY